MSLHNTLDKFESKTPKQKVVTILLALAVVITVVIGIAYAGHKILSGWADSEYLRERQKTQEEVAVLKADAAQHEKNEQKLGIENELLKKQNEDMAKALQSADTDRERKALADQAKRDADHAAKLKEIENDQDYNNQLAATCREYAARGDKLSFCEGIQ
jgi:hypothetical protein